MEALHFGPRRHGEAAQPGEARPMLVPPGSAADQLLTPERVALAKRAFTTRRVPVHEMQQLIRSGVKPRCGDLVLARVERLGQHNALQLPSGRRATLFIGDEIVVAYGNRYAPDQFEAIVPEDLDECELIAAGGMASRLQVAHRRMRSPTRIQPLGLVADSEGRVLNLSHHRLAAVRRDGPAPSLMVVVGTAMNAGKTTSGAHLIRGLVEAGLRVGAAKLTGTGASGDTALMQDAGAWPVYDFTDAGLASTYLAGPLVVEEATQLLLDQLALEGVDVIVAEIADGLLQRETAALLQSPRFAAGVTGVLFAAPDSMGAVAGVEWLERRGLPVVAVSGALTQSPLAVREARAATRLPVLGTDELAAPENALQLLGAARHRSADAVTPA